MGFSRQEYWSGVPFPSPGDLPASGIEPGSPALQTDALPSEPPGKSQILSVKLKATPSTHSGANFNIQWKTFYLPTHSPSLLSSFKRGLASTYIPTHKKKNKIDILTSYLIELSSVQMRQWVNEEEKENSLSLKDFTMSIFFFLSLNQTVN